MFMITEMTKWAMFGSLLEHDRPGRILNCLHATHARTFRYAAISSLRELVNARIVAGKWPHAVKRRLFWAHVGVFMEMMPEIAKMGRVTPLVCTKVHTMECFNDWHDMSADMNEHGAVTMSTCAAFECHSSGGVFVAVTSKHLIDKFMQVEFVEGMLIFP